MDANPTSPPEGDRRTLRLFDLAEYQSVEINRMPVILPESAWSKWLGEEEEIDRDELLALLKPYDGAKTRAYPVGSAVGNVKNQGPQLMEPVPA